MHAPLAIQPAELPVRDREHRPIRHLTLPFHVTATADPLPGETIGAAALRMGVARRVRDGRRQRWVMRLPTVAVVNGKPVLQRQWKRRRIKSTDVVEFWSRPWGKQQSGKQIVGLVALIALAAFAPWAGGVLADAIGFGATAANVISGAILVGGALLVASLTQPKAGGQNATDSTTGDQIAQFYTTQAAGNTARLFQPIAVQYGRLKTYPDYASRPWSEFIGSESYLNVLLSVGMGKYAYEQVLMDDSVVWNSDTGIQPGFAASIAFYDPNTPVTLFPTNVFSSEGVSGQEIVATNLGPFIVCPSGETVNYIASDLIFGNGLFKVPDNAQVITDVDTVSVTVVGEYQQVNDAGTPVGSWTQLFTNVYTNNTKKPIRMSVKTPVGAGRYQVRYRRTNQPNDPNAPGGSSGHAGTVSDNVYLASVRGFITNNPPSFPSSTVAIRIRSTQLTGNAARKFGVVSTRKLNVWNGSTFVEQASRNPFWAAWDAVTNTTYGFKRPQSKVDFSTLYSNALAADARGDTFDYRFDSAVAAPEALDTILRVTRSRHRWSGDVLTFVRDEWASVPRMLITDREIIRGTLSLEYAMNTDNAADAVIVEYFDETTWSPSDVQYPSNSETFTAVNPTRLRLPGLLNREFAYREAAFYYLQSFYRRIGVTLDTEHDGRLLGFGSRVRVQTELPLSWGASGVVAGRSGNTLTLSPAPQWTGTGPFYVAVRTKTGRQFGPILCTRGANDSLAILDTVDLASVETALSMTLDDALTRKTGADDPSFDFGPGELRARDCIVMTGRPSRDRVTLGLVVDRQEVHETDLGDAPILPTVPTLIDPKVPQISGFYAQWRQSTAESILDASWFPAAGAVFYVVQLSYDSGTTWRQIYEGSDPSCSVTADPGAVTVRVSGFGVNVQGAWVQTTLEAPTVVIGHGTVVPTSFEDGLHDYVTSQLQLNIDDLVQKYQQIASKAVDAENRNWLDKKKVRSDLVSVSGALSASISEVATVATDNTTAIASLTTTVDARFAGTTGTALSASIATNASAIATLDSAFSSYQTTVNAHLGSLDSSVSTNATAIATVDGKVAGSYLLTLDVNGYVSGTKYYNNGTTAYVTFAVDHFQIAWPGMGGGSPVPVFAINNVNGSAKLAFRGDMYADGDILARHLSAGSVTTAKLDARAVDAGKIAIDGVDILNIIDGAATSSASASGSDVNVFQTNINTAPLGGPLFTGTANYTLASVSFSAEIGTVDIGAQTSFSYTVYVYKDSKSTWFHYVEVLVDGVVKATYAANVMWLDDYPAGSNISKGFVSFNGLRSIKVTGVSTSGPKTYLIRSRMPTTYDGGAAGHPGTIKHSQNYVTVFERRN